MSEDEKKEIDPVFIEELQKRLWVLKYFVEVCIGSILLGGIGTFIRTLQILEHFC